METKDINQLIKKYSLNIEAFEQVRKDYLDKSTSIQEGNKIFLRNDEEANMAFKEKLKELLGICVSEAGIKRYVRLLTEYYAENHIAAYIEDDDHDNNYSLKFFGEFILVGNIDGEKLKYVDDSFWMLLAELNSKYKVVFKETGVGQETRSKYPQLYKKNSTFIRMMRNFYVHEMLYGKVKDFGPLCIKFDRDTPFERLILQIVEAFCIFNRANELLHKAYVKSNP